MRLADAGRRFERRLRILDGPHFYGQFLDIPDTTRVSNFNSARRILRTRPTGPVQPGQIVVARDRTEWLVGEHGLSENDHHYFKLFEIDERLPWARQFKLEDPLTGLAQTEGQEQLGTIRGTYERRVDAIDALGVPEPANVFITNAAVRLHDLVGGRKVERVDRMLGLYIAEVVG